GGLPAPAPPPGHRTVVDDPSGVGIRRFVPQPGPAVRDLEQGVLDEILRRRLLTGQQDRRAQEAALAGYSPRLELLLMVAHRHLLSDSTRGGPGRLVPGGKEVPGPVTRLRGRRDQVRERGRAHV